MADTYHHGDLRRALLDAGAAALAVSGVDGLSLRGLARDAGVSPAAVYHHFAGKAGLVAALAEDALWSIDAALAAAVEAEADPVRRYRALGVAYVAFAVDHPERFRLAFGPTRAGGFAGMAETGGPLPAERPAFRQLVRVVQGLDPAPDDPVEVMVASWGLVHGVAMLILDGPLAAMVGGRDRLLALAGRLIDRLQV